MFYHVFKKAKALRDWLSASGGYVDVLYSERPYDIALIPLENFDSVVLDGTFNLKELQKETTLAYIDSMISRLEGKKKDNVVFLDITNIEKVENDLMKASLVVGYNQCLDEQIAQLKEERRLIENEN